MHFFSRRLWASLGATLVLCGLALCLSAAPALAATTYFISPAGNDNNAGTQAAPFQTIQQGLNLAVTGDTVTLVAGTYSGLTFTNEPTL